jgi:predicted PurR-regulated permease PerM
MTLTEKDVKKMSLIFFVVILGILVFLVVRPVLFTVIGGMILAYIFLPVHRWIAKRVKSKTLSAAMVSALVLIIILLPIWFLAPIMIKQVFNVFQYSQNLNIHGFVSDLLPSASEEITSQISIGLTQAISKLTSLVLNGAVDFILDFPIIFLHVLLAAFVFFFALKEEESLREFASGLSPLNKQQEAKLVKQFKDMTQAVIYGQIILGLVQGLFAGIGFLIFGVPNALILTIVATILSIIPVIGPSLVYFPVTIYLLVLGKPFIAMGFLLYNLLIVSTIDNLLRAHIVSRRTQVSQVVILVGMIGGLFIFGALGLILGPLILAYFITFLKAYKDKTLSSMFAS